MNRKKFFISLALAMFAMAGNAAASQTDPQADGNLPALRVEGKNLVDANGKTVVLHGVNTYHMILDTTKLGIENCADILIRYFERVEII